MKLASSQLPVGAMGSANLSSTSHGSASLDAVGSLNAAAQQYDEFENRDPKSDAASSAGLFTGMFNKGLRLANGAISYFFDPQATDQDEDFAISAEDVLESSHAINTLNRQYIGAPSEEPYLNDLEDRSNRERREAESTNCVECRLVTLTGESPPYDRVVGDGSCVNTTETQSSDEGDDVVINLSAKICNNQLASMPLTVVVSGETKARGERRITSGNIEVLLARLYGRPVVGNSINTTDLSLLITLPMLQIVDNGVLVVIAGLQSLHANQESSLANAGDCLDIRQCYVSSCKLRTKELATDTMTAPGAVVCATRAMETLANIPPKDSADCSETQLKDFGSDALGKFLDGGLSLEAIIKEVFDAQGNLRAVIFVRTDNTFEKRVVLSVLDGDGKAHQVPLHVLSNFFNELEVPQTLTPGSVNDLGARISASVDGDDMLLAWVRVGLTEPRSITASQRQCLFNIQSLLDYIALKNPSEELGFKDEIGCISYTLSRHADSDVLLPNLFAPNKTTEHRFENTMTDSNREAFTSDQSDGYTYSILTYPHLHMGPRVYEACYVNIAMMSMVRRGEQTAITPIDVAFLKSKAMDDYNKQSEAARKLQLCTGQERRERQVGLHTTTALTPSDGKYNLEIKTKVCSIPAPFPSARHDNDDSDVINCLNADFSGQLTIQDRRIVDARPWVQAQAGPRSTAFIALRPTLSVKSYPNEPGSKVLQMEPTDLNGSDFADQGCAQSGEVYLMSVLKEQQSAEAQSVSTNSSHCVVQLGCEAAEEKDSSSSVSRLISIRALPEDAPQASLKDATEGKPSDAFSREFDNSLCKIQKLKGENSGQVTPGTVVPAPRKFAIVHYESQSNGFSNKFNSEVVSLDANGMTSVSHASYQLDAVSDGDPSSGKKSCFSSVSKFVAVAGNASETPSVTPVAGNASAIPSVTPVAGNASEAPVTVLTPNTTSISTTTVRNANTAADTVSLEFIAMYAAIAVAAFFAACITACAIYVCCNKGGTRKSSAAGRAEAGLIADSRSYLPLSTLDEIFVDNPGHDEVDALTYLTVSPLTSVVLEAPQSARASTSGATTVISGPEGAEAIEMGSPAMEGAQTDAQNAAIPSPQVLVEQLSPAERHRRIAAETQLTRVQVRTLQADGTIASIEEHLRSSLS